MLMEKRSGIATSLFTGIFIIAMSLCLIIMPKKDFSENENRYLSAFPELTVKSITSGKFMDEINVYLTDHFPARDFWISLKTQSEIILGKSKINGVYIAKDDYLIGDYDNISNTDLIKEKFKNFNEALLSKNPKLNVKLMLVPTSITINSDKLPFASTNENQLDTINTITEYAGIDTVDLYDEFMANRDKQLFYRTDHHWTTDGAYIAYKKYCEKAGFRPADIATYNKETVTDSFLGTYASKVNRFSQKSDSINIYTNPLDKLTVCYEDTNEITDSIYELSYVDKKDKYSLFLNNLHPLITITNDNAESDRCLMLVKDSYANSMVAFLARHYNKIYVFDTRYYKFGPSSFIDEHSDITDVLILYNLATMDTDTGIRGIF